MGFTGGVALRALNALEAVVTDDAPPDGVVQIENQCAATFASERGEQAREVIRVEGQKAIGEWELREVPFGWGMPIGEADGLSEVRDIEQDVGGAKNRFRKTKI